MYDPAKVVTAFIAAVEAKDLDTALGFVTDDVSYENVPIAPIVGKQAMRATLDSFLKPAKGVEWRMLRQVVSGNLVINERLDRFQIGDGWQDLPIAGFFEVTAGSDQAAGVPDFPPSLLRPVMGRRSDALRMSAGSPSTACVVPMLVGFR